RAVQRGDRDGAVRVVRVRRVLVRDHPVPAGRARPAGAHGGAVPGPRRGGGCGAVPPRPPGGRRGRAPAPPAWVPGGGGASAGGVPGRRWGSAGAGWAWGGGLWLGWGPPPRLPAALGVYLFFGIAVGTITPPITNSAVSGMPASMAGVAASLASAGRQTGTALGVAISGTIVGPALARGGTAFTGAAHGVWWMVLGLGLGIVVLGLL